MSLFYYEQREEIPMTLEDYGHARDHLIGLISNVYQTYRDEDFEVHLEEVLKVFGLAIPEQDPVIERKQPKHKTDHMLDEWKNLARSFANDLCNK